MKKCESCGKPYAESKDVFCPHCGAVAATKCTHGSSFDSSKWDRGEIYTQNDGNTYRRGIEPHAQRVNDTSASSSDNGTVDYKYMVNIPKSGAKKLDWESLKKIVGIIMPVVILIAFASGVFGDLFADDYGYGSDYEEVYDTYYDSEISLSVGSASVEVTPDDYGSFFFTIKLDEVGFEEFYTEPAMKISMDLLTEAYYGQVSVSTFASGNTVLTNEEFDDGFLYSQTLGTDDTGGYNGEYPFSVSYFETGEIIYLSDFVLYGDYCTLYAGLPFDAFSCDEDGNVTYYEADYSDDGVTLSECEPEQDISYCPIRVSFEDNEIYTDAEVTADVSEVFTEVVSISADEEG